MYGDVCGISENRNWLATESYLSSYAMYTHHCASRSLSVCMKNKWINLYIYIIYYILYIYVVYCIFMSYIIYLCYILYICASPLEFPLGNGGPGPHHFIEIWIHRFSMLEKFHSIEEMLWIFDRISGKQGVPFYRDFVNQQRSPQNFHLPFYHLQLKRCCSTGFSYV